jgi:hypothetical protein
VSLRDALTLPWLRQSFVLKTARLDEASRHLEAASASNDARKPPAFELGDIVERVRERWRRDGTLDDVARSDRRWLAYTLFYPPSESRVWLAGDHRFTDAFLAECQRAPRLIPPTVRQVLLHYPRELATFAPLRNGLLRSLHHAKRGDLERWRLAVGEFGLLSQNGPSRLALSLFDPGAVPEAVYERARLDDELQAGEFVRLAFQEGLSVLEQHLTKGNAVGLEHRLRVLTAAGKLRFPQDAHVVAHALLRPHIQRRPDEPLRAQLQQFLLRHLHDPRFDRAHWQRVEPHATAVLKRWMLGATLDGFFRLISKNALPTHWKYRQAFWSAYFRKGLISDAWVVLGEDARQLAKTVWSEAPSFASLEGAGDPTQSVLLLQVGALSIAEWSHNGRCRVWRDGSRSAPKFHMPRYRRYELRDAPDFEITHTASESFSWQAKLADFIRRETQCDVRLEEYRV